jgi:hypothetical protein
MFRPVLPAGLLKFAVLIGGLSLGVGRMISAPAGAEELRLPELSPDKPAHEFGPCENTRDANNCARILACIGQDGLWFDGQARGWGRGLIVGALSDGTPCGGTWRYRQTLSIADASLECRDGTKAKVLFLARDSLTGTGVAHGIDNQARRIKVWTGENVIEFLTPEGAKGAELPCGDDPIPIS